MNELLQEIQKITTLKKIQEEIRLQKEKELQDMKSKTFDYEHKISLDEMELASLRTALDAERKEKVDLQVTFGRKDGNGRSGKSRDPDRSFVHRIALAEA